MSIILAEAEKGRLINVFQAFAMNIYESLLTCLQKSDGVIMSLYYGGVGSTDVCCIELAFLEIEPRLRRMLAENRAALPHKKHCLWDGKCSYLPRNA